MQRCDVCFEPSDDITKINDELQGPGLHHICPPCGNEVAKAITKAYDQMDRLKKKVRFKIWQRFLRIKKPDATS